MRPFLTPGRVGALLVGVSLLLLYFSEPLLTPRKHRFEITPTEPVLTTLPLDQPLVVYSSGKSVYLKGSQKLSLEQIFSKLGPNKKKLIINFWATWCDPCVEEIPSLNSLYAQLNQKSSEPLPEIITVSVDETAEAIKKLQAGIETPIQFPILHDPDGAFAKTLGVVKFPETFLVSNEGKILYKWIGPQDWLSMEIIESLKFMRLAN